MGMGIYKIGYMIKTYLTECFLNVKSILNFNIIYIPIGLTDTLYTVDVKCLNDRLYCS